MFNALDDDMMIQIAHKFMNEFVQRLAQKDIKLEVSSNVYQAIVKEGSDAHYGARPMKRYIQRNIETKVARYMLQEGLMKDGTLHLDYADNQFILS